MKAVLFILSVQCITELTFKKTTLTQNERIHVLRQKIKEDISSKTNESIPLNSDDYSTESLDYKLKENLPITPIIEKHAKYRLTTLKFDNKNGRDTTIDKLIQDGGAGKGNKTVSQLRSKKRIKKKHNVRVRKPLDIYYRRQYKTEMFELPLEWVHCQDIITPFLTGAKLNISNPKRFSANDPTVVRLVSLLKVNTTSYGREDIYSILHQISNLNLRFFRWDVGAMKTLFNVIIKDKRHTFANLKHGLKDLFKIWRMDLSNSTALLRQARIFRPPCVYVATSEGSTKNAKVTLYPKKIISTTACEEYDEDCKD